MYHFYRTIMLCLLWLSLLVVPLMILESVCFSGLCGGAVVDEVKRNSSYVPIICLLPLVYVVFQVNRIETGHSQQVTDYYRIHPGDFVYSPGKFFRYIEEEEPKRFLFFNINPSGQSVDYEYSYKDLKEVLKKEQIDIVQCKDQKGTAFF